MKKITSFFYRGFNRVGSFLLFLLTFLKKKIGHLGLVQKWRCANHSRESLLELLTRADPKATYQQRCEWCIELVLWVKTRSVSSYFEDKVYPEHTRTHYLRPLHDLVKTRTYISFHFLNLNLRML